MNEQFSSGNHGDYGHRNSVKPKKHKRGKGEIMEDMMVKVMKIVTDSIKSSDKKTSKIYAWYVRVTHSNAQSCTSDVCQLILYTYHDWFHGLP